MLAAICRSMAIWAMRGVRVVGAPWKTTRSRCSPGRGFKISLGSLGEDQAAGGSGLGAGEDGAYLPSSTTVPSSKMATRLQMASTTDI